MRAMVRRDAVAGSRPAPRCFRFGWIVGRGGGRLVVAAVVAAAGTWGAAAPRAQERQEPAAETFHWVLPADRDGVEVATLHPTDCYVVHQAEGTVYFGERTAPLDTLQGQLPPPGVHRVETLDEHGECADAGCVDLARLEAAIEQEMETGNRRRRRRADHRPSPMDRWYGGAYTDVGSDERARFRNAPEQRMVFRHLATARRGNCYEAKALRTLTIHVRDHEQRAQRSGVYHGLLTIRHRHAEGRGGAVAD